jgi:hypothetical protein
MLRPLLVVFFALGLLSTNASCPGTGPDPLGPITAAIIECGSENQTSISSLIGEFKTLLKGKLPDWGAIYQKAKGAGKAIGGCALATLVQEYLGNRAAPPDTADSWTAATTLDKFRYEVAGGATFRMKVGDL